MTATYKLPECDKTANCPGHAGKFQDCLAEAVYEMSLDQYGPAFEESTGSTEFEGHFTLMKYGEDHVFGLDPDRTVLIPRGHYIVESAPGGAVYLIWHGHHEAAARDDFDKYRRSYEKWEGADE